MNLGVRQLGWVGRDQKNDPLLNQMLCMYVCMYVCNRFGAWGLALARAGWWVMFICLGCVKKMQVSSYYNFRRKL